jgi:DNA-directed RNA polymerase alpha subunit
MHMLEPSPQLPDATLIADIALPTRIRNVLLLAGLKTVGEVRRTSDKTFLTLQDFGARSIATLRRLLGTAVSP